MEKCQKWLKEAYRRAVEYICEQCNRHEHEVGELEPHRINPGYKGGTYKPSNVQMLCKECHKSRAEDW